MQTSKKTQIYEFIGYCEVNAFIAATQADERPCLAPRRHLYHVPVMTARVNDGNCSCIGAGKACMENSHT